MAKLRFTMCLLSLVEETESRLLCVRSPGFDKKA